MESLANDIFQHHYNRTPRYFETVLTLYDQHQPTLLGRVSGKGVKTLDGAVAHYPRLKIFDMATPSIAARDSNEPVSLEIFFLRKSVSIRRDSARKRSTFSNFPIGRFGKTKSGGRLRALFCLRVC